MGKFWDTLEVGTRLALCRFAEGGALPRVAGGASPKGPEISPDDLHKLVHIDEHTRAAAHKLALAELQVGIAKENLFKAIASRLEGEISRTIDLAEQELLARAFLRAFGKLLKLLHPGNMEGEDSKLLPPSNATTGRLTIGYGFNAICLDEPTDGVSSTTVDFADDVDAERATIGVRPPAGFFCVYYIVVSGHTLTVHVKTNPGVEHPKTATVSVYAG